MITGDGTTARFTRQFYGDVPWLWICDDVQMSDRKPELERLWETIKSRIDENTHRDVMISSQVPVGTTHRCETMWPGRRFAYMPENYRVVNGDPEKPSYWILGWRHSTAPFIFTDEIDAPMFRMSPESAEMVKHATNTFLALEIEFAHEIATLSERWGADPDDVARGLMADPRIGAGAYLRPGGGPSSHLLREVWNLQRLGGGKLINTLEGP